MSKVIDARIKGLDTIKIRYDEASIKDRGQLKVEWYKKVDEIVAIIRQDYGKNKKSCLKL